MKKTGFLIVLILLSNHVFSQAPTFDWVKRIGAAGSDVGYEIIVDASGNIYTTGIFSETVDFDPGVGVFNLTAAGNYDIFISKMDAAGNLLWAKNMGGANLDYGFSVALDPLGNLYITGNFLGTADFDPGPATFNMNSAGNYDIFVCKLNASGNFVWAKRMGTTTIEESFSIGVDAAGNSYITGKFSGTVDFNPGPGVFNLTASGFEDVYILKLDAVGNFVWAQKIGGASIESSYALKVDPTGNVYITGRFTSTCDFDPGPATFNMTTSVLTYDAFILKLNSSGGFTWAKQISGNDDKIGYSIDVDPSGNVYTTGHFAGTADFDPGGGVFNMTTTASSTFNVFISKLDASGNFVWAKKINSASTANAFGLNLDAAGNPHISGYFKDTADFDPGPATFNLTTSGSNDIFVAKLNSNGNFEWAKNMKGKNNHADRAESICVDASGNVYTTGFFVDTVDFDPGPGIFNLVSDDTYNDIFILKLSICSATSTDIREECSPFTWINGVVYTTNNNSATWTIPNGASNGCDSIITLNLTIKQSTSATQNITQCNSYTWPVNGVTYTNSTNTTHTIPNHVGCDSVITLNLIIKPSSSSTQNVTQCDSYTWPVNGVTYNNSTNTTHTVPNHVGCDSVITLNLTIKQSSSATQNITACNTYTWPVNGTTYTNSTNTTHTIPNHLGCDSVITLNLTIHNSTSSTQNMTACNSYTWPVNGVTYNASTSVNHTIPNHFGCDSVITLNLTIHNSTSATQNMTACNSYTWPVNGTTYTNSINTTHTIPNHFGCDSVITLNLTIHNNSSATQNITECNSYTWPVNGTTYTNSINTNHTISNHFGCDSVITLNLTIHNNTSSTQNMTACNSYTWPVNGTTYTNSTNTTHTIPNHFGCDSVITLNLTINNGTANTQNFIACDSFTWEVNGVTYTSSTNTTHTVPNHLGCDSVITLNLTVNNANAGISQAGAVLTSNPADSYQWMDCDNGNTIIPGATSQVFTATSNGDYAVIVSDNSCTDTSGCVSVNNVGVENNTGELSFHLFPNPSQSYINLSFNQEVNHAVVKILSATGQVMFINKNVNGTLYTIDISEFAPAIYFVQVQFNYTVHTLSLIKK